MLAASKHVPGSNRTAHYLLVELDLHLQNIWLRRWFDLDVQNGRAIAPATSAVGYRVAQSL